MDMRFNITNVGIIHPEGSEVAMDIGPGIKYSEYSPYSSMKIYNYKFSKNMSIECSEHLPHLLLVSKAEIVPHL